LPQLALFHHSESVLVDDASGRIAYTPRFVDGPTALAWFAELRETVPWKAERRRMYDREVDVPRLTAHFDLGPEDPARPAAIQQAADRVIGTTEVPFNSVGLNFYRDGRDSLAQRSPRDPRRGIPDRPPLPRRRPAHDDPRQAGPY
jgi:alkylated DNA repair dioxygenase AlkB